MRKSAPWHISISLLAAVCLTLPAQAAPELPAQQIQAELETSWLELPNAQADRLERYTLWVARNPELDRETVVLQVNLDLDRTPYGSGSLRPEAAQAFREMAEAAREEGIALRSVSAYRSYSYQNALYSRYLTQYRQNTADTFSARPGHSEHQTGLALDINTASTRDHFENTPAFAWLKEHCAQYGFILRYDQGKEDITGYRFEPWHYRYVGVETAQAVMEQGLAYEEYLALQPN